MLLPVTKDRFYQQHHQQLNFTDHTKTHALNLAKRKKNLIWTYNRTTALDKDNYGCNIANGDKYSRLNFFFGFDKLQYSQTD